MNPGAQHPGGEAAPKPDPDVQRAGLLSSPPDPDWQELALQAFYVLRNVKPRTEDVQTMLDELLAALSSPTGQDTDEDYEPSARGPAAQGADVDRFRDALNEIACEDTDPMKGVGAGDLQEIARTALEASAGSPSGEEPLTRAQEAFAAAKWNVADGFDPESAVIVERASWAKLRAALAGQDDDA